MKDGMLEKWCDTVMMMMMMVDHGAAIRFGRVPRDSTAGTNTQQEAMTNDNVRANVFNTISSHDQMAAKLTINSSLSGSSIWLRTLALILAKFCV